MKDTVHISGVIFYEKMKMKKEGKIKGVTEKKNKGKTKELIELSFKIKI